MIDNILDLIFPPVCLGCNKIGFPVCLDCLKGFIPTQRDTCPYCFLNSKMGATHARCMKKYGLDGAMSVILYNKTAKKFISKIKYHMAYGYFKRVIDRIPGFWFEKFIEFLDKKEELWLQPIPLHIKKKRLRGFNQATLVSNCFSEITKLKEIDILIKFKDTFPQAQIRSKKEREKNISGAFILKQKTALPKNIILVDDIYTSASTAKEAAKVLKKAGCEKVYLFTLAHGR